MSRDKTIKFLRTTRANLDAQKTAGNLNAGEPYFITDENKFAIGTATNNYVDIAASGIGDMLKATYDPNSKNGDAFNMDNMVAGTTNKLYTATIDTRLANTSGTNTGDQTLAGLGGVPTTRTVNGHALSADVTVTKSDVSLGNVPNIDATSSYHFSVLTRAGEIKVPSGDTDFIPPLAVAVPTGYTLTLKGIRYKINGGTSVSFRLQKNGADITSYGTSGTPLTCNTTAAETYSDVSLADNDELSFLVSAVSGTPMNLYCRFEFIITKTA